MKKAVQFSDKFGKVMAADEKPEVRETPGVKLETKKAEPKVEKKAVKAVEDKSVKPAEDKVEAKKDSSKESDK